MDDRAYAALEEAPANIRDVVIADFKPRSEGDSDYSALVHAFIRAVTSRASIKPKEDRKDD